MKKCGGFTDDRDADDKVKGIALGVKADVEKALGATCTKFDAVTFSTQVVAGTNYKIKVDIGDGKYIHLKVHVPLPKKMNLINYYLKKLERLLLILFK